ncbi:hypothetical protein GGQ67_003555 [Rhizobium metallidurans]|uniref:Uncharacterized protein n=1 Tax=Rhizobium metallidurans TaxID=1265931 RepID=A0A7W6GDQ0_9HYPH|nr:hypothetical protein [Rhizobium metallidurans]
MKLHALLPLLTYPDANSEIIAPNAAAVAHYLGADLHALALEADIPAVSNALSNVLMNLPEMILDAEKLSARRGADLLAAVTAACATADVALTTETIRGHCPSFPTSPRSMHAITTSLWSAGAGAISGRECWPKRSCSRRDVPLFYFPKRFQR